MLQIIKRKQFGLNIKLSLKRAIISYIIVFLIPIIIMTLLVQISIINSIYSNAKKSMCDELLYTKLILDQQLGNFSTIVNYVFFDKTIKSSDLPRDYLSFLEIQTDLRRISISNPIINEFSIYQEGSEYIVSTKSSYHLKHFLDMFPINEIKDTKEFYNYLNQEKGLRLLHAEVKSNKEKQCLFVYSSNNVRGGTKQILIFATLESGYHNALKKALGQNVGCSFVTDTAGNIISYYCTDKKRSYKEYFSKLSESRINSEDIITDYNGYLTYSIKSDYIPIMYSIVVSEESFVRQTSYIRFMWYGVIFVAILFGLATALLLGHKSYKPINSLRLKASTFYNHGQSVNNDDYHYLHDAMEYIGFKNTMLQNNLDDINDYIIFKLLKGTLISSEEIEIIAKLIGVSLYNTLFKVLIIESEVDCSKKTVHTELLSTLPQSVHILMRNKEIENTYVIILACDKNTADYKKLLYLTLSEGYTISHGSFQPDIRHIPLSYMEALTGTSGSPLYNEVFTQLEGSINAVDYQRSITILHGIISSLKKGNMKLADAKLLVIRFVLLITNTGDKLGNHVDVSVLPDTFMVLHYESLEDAILFFECYGEKLMKELLCPNTKHGDILYEQMVIYLKNHYRNLNFSFQQMADEFNITLPVLSRQFQDFSGQTLTDFTTDIKMDTVKNLLTTTNLSINDIAMEVGYYNVNSFIRWFKKLTNETPGSYRARRK